MKFKVGDKIRRISNPVSICEVVIADPTCALYDIAGMPRAGYAVIYPDGTKSWDVSEHIEREFELENPMRTLVYEEDSQLYCKKYFLFNTNCPWAIAQLSRLSWRPAAAGRISTAFTQFQELLRGEGFTCDQQGESKVNNYIGNYDLVEGAYGNY